MSRGFWGATGLLVSTTIGAGIFALPYVTTVSGWPAVAFYLAAVSALLIFVHYELAAVIAKDGGGHRLSGLASRYFGPAGARVAHVAIVGGLIFTLVAYLILAGRFIAVIFPVLSPAAAVGLFWLVGSFPLLLSLRRMVWTEFLGSLLMAAIILVTFFSAGDMLAGFGAAPGVRPAEIFFPFAPVLFALAAWTAVGSMVEYSAGRVPRAALVAGTVISAVLYALFVAGILGSATNVAPDTLSGLSNWPAWRQILLAVLGLFAVWTSFVPMADELRDSLARDFGVRERRATAAVLFAPLLLVGLGIRDFLTAIGLAGGVFLGIQYIAIALVARKALAPSGLRRLLLHLTVAIFAAAAGYEIYHMLAISNPSPSSVVVRNPHAEFSRPVLSSATTVVYGVLGEDQTEDGYDIIVDRGGKLTATIQWDYAPAYLEMELFDKWSDGLALSNPSLSASSTAVLMRDVEPGAYRIGVSNPSSAVGAVRFRLEARVE